MPHGRGLVSLCFGGWRPPPLLEAPSLPPPGPFHRLQLLRRCCSSSRGALLQQQQQQLLQLQRTLSRGLVSRGMHTRLSHNPPVSGAIGSSSSSSSSGDSSSSSSGDSSSSSSGDSSSSSSSSCSSGDSSSSNSCSSGSSSNARVFVRRRGRNNASTTCSSSGGESRSSSSKRRERMSGGSSSSKGGRSAFLLAPAGSGKTLAYLLPLLSRLYLQPAAAAGAARGATGAGGRPGQPHCPRLIILVPTRELAKQLHKNAVLPLAAAAAVTDISSSSRRKRGAVGEGGPLSCCVLSGGGRYAAEVLALSSGTDIVVATPARLLLHLKKRNLLLQQLQQLVVEEADTLCDTFYANETHFILSLVTQQRHITSSSSSNTGSSNTGSSSSRGVQLVFVGAAYSGALAHFIKTFKPHGTETHFLRHGSSSSSSNTSSSSSSNNSSSSSSSILSHALERVTAGVVHSIAASCQQDFVCLGNAKKLQQLAETLATSSSSSSSAPQTLVFCNTIKACRAVDHHLRERGFLCSHLHGEMPFALRQSEFERFLKGRSRVLVTTDVCSRGLDLPNVKHVLMFDMPEELGDYLHRVGRVSRGSSTGRLTAFYGKKDIPLLQQVLAATAATTHQQQQQQQQKQQQGALGGVSFLSRRTRRIIKLQRRWQELIDMKNPKRKVGGRKAIGLAPRRGLASPKNKHYLKQLHFKLKAEKKLRELQKRGLIRKAQKLPRRVDSVVERSEAQQTPKLVRGADGHLQVFAVRRSKRKKAELLQQHEAGRYEDERTTHPIPGAPVFGESKARGDRRPLF
ncbi:hypothetical protein Esti_000262 [Eimeria stiedai]